MVTMLSANLMGAHSLSAVPSAVHCDCFSAQAEAEILHWHAVQSLVDAGDLCGLNGQRYTHQEALTFDLKISRSTADCLPCMVAQGNGETKRREEQRRKNCTPTDTLFVVNFDPDTTHERHLEEHFAPYGKLKRVQVKKNYGFVQYELLDDAIAARASGLEAHQADGYAPDCSSWFSLPPS